jgi:hypothetical protein
MPRNNVELFPGATPADPDAVLASAMGKLSQVLIIGYDLDRLEYQEGSDMSDEDVLWMLERAKLRLLRTVDGDE